jgi:hypothetical protein
VKSEQLLTQGKIFEDDILAGPECTNHPAEEVPKPYDHAQNLTGTLSIELGAKSLILRVYDVLMNDTGSVCRHLKIAGRAIISRFFHVTNQQPESCNTSGNFKLTAEELNEIESAHECEPRRKLIKPQDSN